jgi:hypothetical protein
MSLRTGDLAMLDTCHGKAVELLRTNAVRGGVLAATAKPAAVKRGYTAIFGRDAAVCAIGMALSGNAALQRIAGEHPVPDPRGHSSHQREPLIVAAIHG